MHSCYACYEVVRNHANYVIIPHFMLVNPSTARHTEIMFILDESSGHNLCQKLIQQQCRKQRDIYVAWRKVMVICTTLTASLGRLMTTINFPQPESVILKVNWNQNQFYFNTYTQHTQKFFLMKIFRKFTFVLFKFQSTRLTLSSWGFRTHLQYMITVFLFLLSVRQKYSHELLLNESKL